MTYLLQALEEYKESGKVIEPVITFNQLLEIAKIAEEIENRDMSNRLWDDSNCCPTCGKHSLD